MREDENSWSSEGSDSRRRTTTMKEPREVRDERTSITEQHVPRRISGKMTPSEHTQLLSPRKRHWKDPVRKQ